MNSMIRLVLVFLCLSPWVCYATPFDNMSEVVIGRGEIVMSDDMTIKDAYDQAEVLAKIDASKQIGEYFEVLRVADSKSGDIKEVISSVNATVMKYQVVSKSLDSRGLETVAVVVIETKADSADLDMAMSRYYDNQQYKDEIEQAQSKLKAVEIQLLEQARLVKKIAELESALMSASTGGVIPSDVARLQNLLAVNKRNVSKAVLEFKRVTVLKRLDRVVVVDIDAAKKAAEVKLVNDNIKKEAYRKSIEALIDAYTVKPIVKVQYDLGSNTTRLQTDVHIELDKYNSAAMRFEGQFVANDTGFSSKRKDVRAPFIYDAREEHLNYALYLVIDVGGYKHDIPLVLPRRLGRDGRLYLLHGACNFGKDITDLKTRRAVGLSNSEKLQNKPIICVENGLYGEGARDYIGKRATEWTPFFNEFRGETAPNVSYSFELRDIAL